MPGAVSVPFHRAGDLGGREVTRTGQHASSVKGHALSISGLVAQLALLLLSCRRCVNERAGLGPNDLSTDSEI